MRLQITPIGINASGAPQRAWKACNTCGFMPSNPEEMRKHLVEAHDMKMVGAQVFVSHRCLYCDKSALYRIGKARYCRDHKDLAVQRRVKANDKKSLQGMMMRIPAVEHEETLERCDSLDRLRKTRKGHGQK